MTQAERCLWEAPWTCSQGTRKVGLSWRQGRGGGQASLTVCGGDDTPTFIEAWWAAASIPRWGPALGLEAQLGGQEADSGQGQLRWQLGRT